MLWASMMGLTAAQQSVSGLPSGTQLNPGTVAGGAGNFIVIGCISREGQGASETFVMTDPRPTPPVQYRLAGDPDLLRFHVGHTVEIAGPIAAAAGGATAPTLKVQSLTYVSTTCVKLK
jgi:hypothetical protein